MENKEIHGYIYLITNLVNGKQYVGQTVQTIEERYKGHCDDSKYSKNKTVIDRAINKHGIKNFTVEQIDVAYNQEELNLIEGVYMSWFKTLSPNGYNIKEIINGKGRHSEETREKIKTKANTPERLKLSSEHGKKTRGICRKNSTSKYVGIWVNNGKNKTYEVSICYLNKSIYFGVYNSEIDAAKAYDIAAIKYFGNDAALNFPELRDDYIGNNIYVERNKYKRFNKSGEKNIFLYKRNNTWFFQWFSKTLNRNTTKFFKTLEEAINFKNEKILDKDYLEFKSDRK